MKFNFTFNPITNAICFVTANWYGEPLLAPEDHQREVGYTLIVAFDVGGMRTHM